VLRKLRGRLTYANVMATVAVFIALGGASYAATQLPKHSVGTKQLRNGAVTYGKIAKSASKRLAGATGATGPQGVAGAPATKLYAQVKMDGTINASSPGVTSAKNGSSKGLYLVNFGQDITHCAAIAMQGALPVFGEPGANTGRTRGSALVDIDGPGFTFSNGYPSADTVEVETYEGPAGSTAQYSAFYIAVFC
jgi:hypothetical protein